MKYWILAVLFILPLVAAAQDEPFHGLVAHAEVSHSPDNTCAAIVISGKEGWKGPVVDIAHRIFAEQNCMVMGVDWNSYMKDVHEKEMLCPCADLIRAAIYFEKTYGLKKYAPPVLVGYHEGTGLAYLSLVQSPFEFAGMVAFGFCPDIVTEFRRPCKLERLDYKRLKTTDGLITLAYKDLGDPLVVIGGDPAGKCSVDPMADFLKKIPVASVLPAQKDWMPQFQTAMNTIRKAARPPASVLPDLPVIEYPSQENDTMVVILSGDGGWVDLGRDLGDSMVSKKIAVLGFDSLQYYWQKKDPNAAAADMSRLINAYLTAWKKQKVLLIGYSYGADVLPFVLHDLSPDLRKRLAGVALIGPSTKTEFEFNVIQLQRDPGPPRGEPLEPQLKNVDGTPVLCIGGDTEKESLCRHIQHQKVQLPNVEIDMMETGHGFGNNTDGLAERILQKFLH